MKLQTTIISLLIILLTFSCGNKQDSASINSEEMSMNLQADQKQQGVELPDIERKLIKEGQVEFETDDLHAARKIIIQSIEKNKGYVSSDQEYKSEGRNSNTLIIRVPAKNFDQLLADATKNVTKFDSKHIEVKDVTEEFLDIQARLKTKKELENRYLELLKKANTVTEILEVERQRGELRSEIESIEGRLKYLESQVSLSTLTMTFYQTVPNQTEFGNKFKNGFKTGWDNLIWFFVFLINIWPFVLIGFGLLFGIRSWRKRKNYKK